MWLDRARVGGVHVGGRTEEEAELTGEAAVLVVHDRRVGENERAQRREKIEELQERVAVRVVNVCLQAGEDGAIVVSDRPRSGNHKTDAPCESHPTRRRQTKTRAVGGDTRNQSLRRRDGCTESPHAGSGEAPCYAWMRACRPSARRGHPADCRGRIGLDSSVHERNASGGPLR